MVNEAGLTGQLSMAYDTVRDANGQPSRECWVTFKELREDLLGLVGGSSSGDAPQPAAAPPAEEQQGQQQAAADAAPLSSGSVVAVAGEHDLLAASREGSFSSVSGASCLLNNGRRLSSVRGSVDAALTAAVCSALEL